jgi:terminase large subunit-like protein
VTTAADLRAALDPVVLFELAFRVAAHDWQRDYLRAPGPVLTVKGRQVGASTAAAAMAVHEVLYRPDVTAAIVSPSLRQSQEIAGKARTALRNLAVPLVQDSSTALRLRNGSRVLSLPGTAKSVRGWSASLLILDEAAYLAPETWAAVTALTAATGGRIVIQSTPALAEGQFHELVTGDDPSWTRFTVPSASVPTIAPTFLDAERRTMTPDEYGREYECTFGSVSSLPRLFPPERLAALFPEVA